MLSYDSSFMLRLKQTIKRYILVTDHRVIEDLKLLTAEILNYEKIIVILKSSLQNFFLLFYSNIEILE